jgi:hypothetical protein
MPSFGDVDAKLESLRMQWAPPASLPMGMAGGDGGSAGSGIAQLFEVVATMNAALSAAQGSGAPSNAYLGGDRLPDKLTEWIDKLKTVAQAVAASVGGVSFTIGVSGPFPIAVNVGVTWEVR